MHDPEKSDSGRVAAKPTNKAGRPAAEPVEPRPGTKGNADQLQGSDEALGDAIALGFAHEGRRSFDAQTLDLVLEIAGHVIGAMIVTQLEPTRHSYNRLSREAAKRCCIFSQFKATTRPES